MADRPQSIIRFEQLFSAYVLAGVVDTVLHWSAYVGSPALAAGTAQLGASFAPLVLAVSVAVRVVLGFFAARRRSTIAKWLIVLLALATASGAALGVARAGYVDAVAETMAVLATALLVGAVVMLFRADSVAWFQGPGSRAEAA